MKPLCTGAFMHGDAFFSAAPLVGGGEMGRRVRETDWSKTPLGAFATWPSSLRTSLSLVLNTKGIAALYWGPEQWLLYNDAYGAALGNRHPEAFGRPMPEVLTDIAPVLGPQVAEVLRTGQGFAIENLSLVMRRHGHDEVTDWTYSFSPVQGEECSFGGVLLLATEMTQQRHSERAREIAESGLRHREAHWRGLFEQLSEGFVLGELVRNGDGKVVDWRYLDVNSAWGRLVGTAPQAAQGRTIREVFPAIEQSWIDEMAEVVSSRRAATFTRQVGSLERWYEGHAFPLEGDRFAVLFLEITQRLANERQLQDSRDRFAALVKASSEALYSMSPDWGEMRQMSGGGFLADTATADPDWMAK